MNKDKKELDYTLEWLKECGENEFLFETYNSKELSDYITNLQEEIKEWEMIFDTFSSRPYAHRYLEEKRKEQNNPHIVGLDSEMIYKDYYDLQQRLHDVDKISCDRAYRIDKAIEYIESYHNTALWEADKENLINILRGKDNE